MWSRKPSAAISPCSVKIIRAQGLEVPMITTDIVDADTPFAKICSHRRRPSASRITASAASNTPLNPTRSSIAAFRPRLAKLAA